MSNPFRVRFKLYIYTQGVALGWYVLPLQGVKKGPLPMLCANF